jgi:hypothetical protein
MIQRAVAALALIFVALTAMATPASAQTITNPPCSAGVGGSCPYTYYQQKWRDIVRRAANTQPWSLSSAPPTVTNESGTFTNSTVVTTAGWNTPSTPANSAAVTSFGGVLTISGDAVNYSNQNASTNTAALTTGGQGWGQAFFFYGMSLDDSYNGFNGSGPVRIIVDNQLIAVQPYTTPQSGQQYIRLDWPVAGLHKVQFIYSYADSIAGYNACLTASCSTATGLIWPAAEQGDQTLGLWFGDSYATGENIIDPIGGLPQQVSQALGIRHVIASGEGGQGWVAGGTSYGNTFGQRITAGDLTRNGSLDLVIMTCSINDHAQSAGAITSAVEAAAPTAWAQHPEAVFLWITGFAGGSAEPNNATANTACVNGITGSSGYNPAQNIILNGYNDAPNWALLSPSQTTDNIHPNYTYPNQGGTPYLASRIANDALAAMRVAGGM